MLRSVSKLLPALLALAALVSPVRAAAQASPPAAAAAPAPAATALRGDVNGDGQVTALDALAVIAYVVGNPLPVDYQIFPNGDANGDGRITTADALVIMGFAMGRDVSRFPVGTAIQVEGRADAMLCVGNLRELTVTCRSQQPPSQLPAGARGTQIYSGQNVYVRLTSSNVSYDSGTQDLTFNVRVTNLIPQPLGVDSLGNVTPDGVRVFVDGRNPAVMEVKDSSGSALFLHDSEPYYQYPGNLAYNDSTANQPWKLHIPSSFANFSFKAYISTEVPKPRGYVVVTPALDTLAANDTVRLTGVVKNWAGVTTGAPVHWHTSDATVASVDSVTGTVTAHNNGTATITARAQPDTSASIVHPSGTATIVVSSPAAAQSVITADSSSLTVGSHTAVKVQIRRANGQDYHKSVGASAVVLTTTAGTLTAGATTATTVTAVDNNDGTYSAVLADSATGTVTVSGTLNGTAIGTSATVIFNPDAPAKITKTYGDSLVKDAGTPDTVRVHVTDRFHNPVPNWTVHFLVIGGGGQVGTGAGPLGTSVDVVTDASGNATADRWMIGSGPTVNKLQVSANPAGTAAPDTFTVFVPPTAGADVEQAMGNQTLPSAPAVTVLSNDATINGGTLKVTSTNPLTTARSGKVTIDSAGSFSYVPAAGVTGRDSVQYDLSDGHATAKGWLKFAFVGKVWHVDNSYGGGQGSPDGRDLTPFTSLSAAEAVASVNDTILVHTGSGTTTGGTLKNGQLLRGQGHTAAFTATLNLQTVTLLGTGTRPNVGALTLGSGNTLRGFTAVGGITGSAFGTLTVSETGINNPSGQALGLTNGTLSGGFDSLISGGGTNNVLLSGVSTSGTATLGAALNTLSGASGDAVVVSGGAGSFTFPGDVSNAASFAVNVNGKTGGAVQFTGSINPGAAGRGISVTGNNSGANSVLFSGGAKNISSGTAAGVVLSNNTGAAISFTGGGLAIATTTGTPFSATGGGTVEVTGSGNTVSATGAAANAVNLNGVTLGANGVTFASISSSGSTTGSAFLANTVGNTSGSSFSAGSLTVAGTTGASSRGIELVSSSAPFTFTTASVNGTGGEGIYLSGNTGAVSVNGGTVGNTSSTTGDALFVNGGNAAITIAPSLTKSSAGRVANINSHSAGSVTLSGNLSCTGSCTGVNVASNSGGTIDFTAGTKTLTTGSNAAVTLSSNTGATVNFSNGGLAISTTSGAGFNATGGGTVTVTTGTNNNTISSGTGTALNVSSTTIGASGLTFRSISASGGSNGIVLSSTGAGGLTVTGDGSTAASGGTIANVTGSDGAVAGNGVYLSSAQNVSLAYMSIHDVGGNGLSGTSVVNLTLNKVRFTGANGDNLSGPYYESAVNLSGLTGSASITGTYISGGMSDNFRLTNSSGTLNRITMTSDTIAVQSGNPTTRLLNDGLFIQGLGTATVNATVQNMQFLAGGGDLFQYDLGGTATGDLVLTGSTFNDGHSNVASGGGGLTVSVGGGGSPTATYTISSNSFRGSKGSAILVSRTSGTGSASGTISNNTVGVTGVDQSGSSQGSAIDVEETGGGTFTATITNNTLRQWSNYGIYTQAGANTAANGGQGKIKLTVQGNTIAEPSTVATSGAFPANGFHVNNAYNTNDNALMCLTLGGSSAGQPNTLNGTGTGGQPDVRLRSRNVGTVYLPGYTGGHYTADGTYSVNSFVAGNNAVSPTVTSLTNSSTGGGGFSNACPF